VAGIMICDYFLIRGRELQVEDLYLRSGIYEYRRGFNGSALVALTIGAGTGVVGKFVPAVRTLYDYSWFVGFAISFVAYYGLMKMQREPGMRAVEEA
jgi:nucleobase:cation symporter-1, NCS1 family